MRSSCVCLAVASIILPTAASLPAHKHRHRLRRVQIADAVVSSSDGSTMQPGAMPINQAPANSTPWFVASQDKGLWPENIATDGTLISLTVRPLQEAVRIESRAWYIGGKLEAEVQSASVTPGIVTSVYLATGLGKNSEGGDGKQDEIDFEWTGKYPTKVQTNVFVTGKGHSAFSNIGINTSAVPDRYGLEWNDTQLHFYLSGSLFRVIPLQHPLRPMQLYMSVWTTTGGWPGLIPWAGAMNWDSREGAPAAASFRIVSFPVEYVEGVVENYAHPLSSDLNQDVTTAAADSTTNTTAANSTATANATASANTTSTTTPSSNASATQVPLGDNSTASANATSAPSPSSNATDNTTSTATGNTAPESNSTNTSTATNATSNAPTTTTTTTTTATPSPPPNPPAAPATETDTSTPPPPTLTPPEATSPLTPTTPSAPSVEPTAPALREKKVDGALARGESEGSYWSRLIRRARVVALARNWWG